ncbi:MAG: DUF3396 domain-containing protein [Burkholderiales bacterium]|nr:DUF3396 domain-containing protein [Burkholderiales bacterium]
MNALPPELIFETEGSTFARLCIDLTFYWRGSMYDRTSSLTEAYYRALAAVKGGIVYFETGTMAGVKKLKADTLDTVPFWLQKAKRREDIFMMLLKGGPSVNEPSDLALQFFADEEEDPPAGAMSLSIPVVAAENPESIVTLMQEIADCADFESGHCGYSMSWEPNADSASDAEARMPGVAGRFPGVDLPKLNTTVLAIQRSTAPGIKTVQWLTLVGERIVESVGGVARLRTLLPASVALHELKNGLLIQAGAAPMIGDSNRAQKLTDVKAVGRALAGCRLMNHAPIFGTDDVMAEWLARFDK